MDDGFPSERSELFKNEQTGKTFSVFDNILKINTTGRDKSIPLIYTMVEALRPRRFCFNNDAVSNNRHETFVRHFSLRIDSLKFRCFPAPVNYNIMALRVNWSFVNLGISRLKNTLS